MTLRKGSKLWVEDKTCAWIAAGVTDFIGKQVQVVTDSGKKLLALPEKLYPRDEEADHGGVDDMTKLTYLNEPGVLDNLQRRYTLNEIYTGQTFHWSSRLSIAAGVADALAFMHQELQHDGIPHGNLKSSNILLNKNMEPRISEYGLKSNIEISTIQNQAQFSSSSNVFPIIDENAELLFKADIYAFGVFLLEMLTGKVQNNGLELASWVVSVLREEWTVEVFDRTLIQEGASEEMMVNLLKVAVKCVNHSPEARPSINHVALMITTIRDEDDRSIDVSASTSTII